MIITNLVCWNTSCLSDLHHVTLTSDGFAVGSWGVFSFIFLCFFVLWLWSPAGTHHALLYCLCFNLLYNRHKMLKKKQVKIYNSLF